MAEVHQRIERCWRPYRESLQIELNRRVYLDEVSREPYARFDHTRRDIDRVLQRITQFIAVQTGATA